MLFHRKQKHLDEINVVINGIEIEHVPSFNFLGIMLDENLSWKSHIEMVGNKISKVTGILYRLKNVFPENVLFVLYNSLIVSYMNYGLLLWGIHSHKLELLQKKLLRLMTNSNYLAHTTPLLIKHGLLNVRDMYKLKLLKFYYKLSYDLLPPYLLLLSTHSSLIIGGSPLLLSDGGSPPASPASHLAGLLRRRDPSTNPGPIAWWVSVGN